MSLREQMLYGKYPLSQGMYLLAGCMNHRL